LFSGPPSILSLTKSSLLARSDAGLIRVGIDLLSSETDPTRTITRLPAGGYTLLDTTQALIQTFDRAGRLIEQRRRTGETQFTVSYVDPQSDRIDRITNAAGGSFTFGYSNGKVRT